MTNTAAPQSEGAFDRNATNVNIVYYLYLASIVLGVTAIVGVIMAFMNRLGTGDWLDTHYTYQIRTFWIGLLFSVLGLVLTLVVVGWLVVLATAVWLILRFSFWHAGGGVLSGWALATLGENGLVGAGDRCKPPLGAG